MKRYLFCIVLVLFTVQAIGYHIVGGEIEFITIQPGLYRINLIQYRDEAQLDNPTPDPDVTVVLFSNKDHRWIAEYTLPLTNQSDVAYTKPECAIAQLKTSRNIYSLEISLDPEEFDEAEGYYIAWERCCRNESIKNIVNPGGTGMKYILEIPPLYKNGQPFINSSPTLLKPLSDYACINQLYYTNFTGTDADGDSLVYKLATPLNTASVVALPITQPKPNIPVTWAAGYSLTNIVPGSQPLRISTKGLLTVNPAQTGLYVFSVIVEEWRSKQKIGEVQRDFQMLVVDGCDPPDPPHVDISVPGKPLFDPETDVLSYTVFEAKCFDFYVTNVTGGEKISLRAEAVNFDEELDGLFSITSAVIGLKQDSLILQVCAPDCPPIRNAPFIIDLIAADDACPLPQMDTLRLMIQVQPPANELPQIAPIQNTFFVNEDDAISIPFSVTDADGDSMKVALRAGNFENFGKHGFSLEITRKEPGIAEGFLKWNTDCLTYDFSEMQYFKVGISVDDYDTCMYEDQVTEWIDFNLILPPNTIPQLSSTGGPEINAYLEDTIFFELDAIDVDGDSLSIRHLVNSGSRVSGLGFSFESKGGEGSASGSFYWVIDCEEVNLLVQDEYRFSFLADDQDKCKVKNYDSLNVNIFISDRVNSSPYFGLDNQSIRVRVNEVLEIPITAYDDNIKDVLSLSFNPSYIRPRSPSLGFEAIVGFSEVSSTLKWTPECDLLDFGENSHTYDLHFLAIDDRCPVSGFKDLKISVEVYEDTEAFNNFLPPNAFTPNGDGRNDTYSLSDLGPTQSLPMDICDNSFEYFTVHDRSGRTIYTSKSRDFVFTGDNVPAGVYYYVVKYTKREYKGFLQVLR